MTRPLKPWQVVVVFLAIVLLHAFSENKTVTDSKWTLHKAYSLYSEGNTDLAEWAPEAAEDSYRIRWVDGKPYSQFPDGAAISAVPLVALLDVSMRAFAGRSYKSELDRWRIGDIQEIWASVLVALATLLLIRTGALLGLGTGASLLLGATLAFASPAWSTATRALWSQTPLLLCNAILIWLIVRGRSPGREVHWLAVGVVCGLGVVARPTAALIALGAVALAMGQGRSATARVVAGGAVVAAAFVAFNLYNYGAALPPYYSPDRVGKLGTFGVAALANLFSPSRGVLVFIPWLPFAGLGLWQLFRHDRRLALVLCAVLLSHLLVVSSFGHWWGGYSYGPRFFCEFSPLFALGLVPMLRSGARGHGLVRATFALSLLASFLVHFAGANIPATYRWNATPVSVDAEPGRVWDWSDPQFLRWQDP